MIPGDRLVCLFIGDKPKNKFTHWPLHLTLVPWFRLNLQSPELVNLLHRKLINLKPMTLTYMGRSLLGNKRNVTMIEATPKLNQLEKIIRQTLKEAEAWLVDESTRKKRNFLPHVTDQKNISFPTNEPIICQRVFLVEQFGRYKQVVGFFDLV